MDRGSLFKDVCQFSIWDHQLQWKITSHMADKAKLQSRSFQAVTEKIWTQFSTFPASSGCPELQLVKVTSVFEVSQTKVPSFSMSEAPNHIQSTPTACCANIVYKNLLCWIISKLQLLLRYKACKVTSYVIFAKNVLFFGVLRNSINFLANLHFKISSGALHREVFVKSTFAKLPCWLVAL